jgi:hypothetical protein
LWQPYIQQACQKKATKASHHHIKTVKTAPLTYTETLDNFQYSTPLSQKNRRPKPKFSRENPRTEGKLVVMS